MSDELTPIARALGRIPSGLFIISSTDGDNPALGFLGSFLAQVGFEPPTVCVAVGKDRAHLTAMRASGHFGVSIMDQKSQGLMSAFFKAPPEGKSVFDDLETSSTPSGDPVLSGSLAWLDCKVTGEHEVGDHIVVFGTVTAAEMLREGDASVHMRKNGLGY
ncbi:MAG: flavin reductase (DIM6/NTAB) family NADH-FMN oxidoreductase RutF [Planctomycetota bacterium]|jgi:flavin reductase (DIM6/NTAB) family NADH-FMN oxidoreductase RutF